MRAYFSAFRMRLRLETQYRGAMIGGILCQLFFGIILVSVFEIMISAVEKVRNILMIQRILNMVQGIIANLPNIKPATYFTITGDEADGESHYIRNIRICE